MKWNPQAAVFCKLVKERYLILSNDSELNVCFVGGDLCSSAQTLWSSTKLQRSCFEGDLHLTHSQVLGWFISLVTVPVGIMRSFWKYHQGPYNIMFTFSFTVSTSMYEAGFQFSRRLWALKLRQPNPLASSCFTMEESLSVAAEHWLSQKNNSPCTSFRF